MGKMTNVTIRIEKDLKERTNNLFSNLGINFSTAVKVFINQCIRENRIPFRISMNSNNNDDVLLILISLYIDCYSGDVDSFISLSNKLNTAIHDSYDEVLRR